MTKLKTKKAASKRFRITNKNKIVRRSQMAAHLKRKKSKNQLRRLRTTKLVAKVDKKRIRQLLPYS